MGAGGEHAREHDAQLPSEPAQSVDRVMAPPPITESRSLHRETRRQIIQKIQHRTGRSLLCYVTRDQGISEEDIRYMQELLYAASAEQPLELMLNSPGGSTGTAVKLVNMLWNSPSNTEDIFRLIVPDEAKSAATLVALGASEIVMSNTSELGPIDPQLQDVDGNWHSVFDYIGAYKVAEDNLREKPDDPSHRMTFDKFDPVRYQSLQQMTEYTRQSAEDLLKRHGGNYTLAPTLLMDTQLFPLHEQVIDWETAKRDIGLNVRFMSDKDPLWRLYWKLYCFLQDAVEGSRKVFESADVSLLV